MCPRQARGWAPGRWAAAGQGPGPTCSLLAGALGSCAVPPEDRCQDEHIFGSVCDPISEPCPGQKTSLWHRVNGSGRNVCQGQGVEARGLAKAAQHGAAGEQRTRGEARPSGGSGPGARWTR